MPKLNHLNRLYPSLPLGLCLFGSSYAIYFLIKTEQFSWLLLTLLGFFLFDSLGVQIGYHKLFSHRSFKTSIFWRRLLAICGLFAGQNSLFTWVAIHRNIHHPFSDTAKDIHSPIHGFFHSLIFWYWRIKPESINYLPLRDLSKDPWLKFLHRYYLFIYLSLFLFLSLLSLPLACFFIALPGFLSNLTTGLVNSALHDKDNLLSKILLLTYSSKESPNGPLNSLWLGPLTLGLGYHGHHHRHPQSVSNAKSWYEFDLSRTLISLIQNKEKLYELKPRHN